jgi:uncharacterized membrane protein
MNTIERISQAILFEVIALIIVIPTTVFIAGYETDKMAIAGIALSMFAMLWNYIYNIFFDKLAGYDRVKRGLAMRITHAIAFEFGMILITLPTLAWYLKITWLEAAMLEAGFLVFILLYTFVFNWLYDRYQPYKRWVSNEQYT